MPDAVKEKKAGTLKPGFFFIIKTLPFLIIFKHCRAAIISISLFFKKFWNANFNVLNLLMLRMYKH